METAPLPGYIVILTIRSSSLPFLAPFLLQNIAFYKFVPPLFVLYLLPAVFNSCGVVGGEYTVHVTITTTYLLPAILVLICLNFDAQAILNLGRNIIFLFFVGTFGVVFGGPLAVAFFRAIWPSVVEGDMWRGLAWTAGSWIGGGANGGAMRDIFEPSPKSYTLALFVDALIGCLWFAILFAMIDKRDWWNEHFFKADPKPVNDLMKKMKDYQLSLEKPATQLEMTTLFSVAFIGAGVAHFLANRVSSGIASIGDETLDRLSLTNPSFWRVSFATLIGVSLSFTPLRKLEGVGASKVATVFLYYMVLTFALAVDIKEIIYNPGILLLGLMWMSIHGILLLFVCKYMRMPLFYFVVCSCANIGGPVSTPVLAGAFDPALAPVGAIFALLGEVVGTWFAWACGLLMEQAAGSPDCEGANCN
jgi:uncharacterized membrane protein